MLAFLSSAECLSCMTDISSDSELDKKTNVRNWRALCAGEFRAVHESLMEALMNIDADFEMTFVHC